MQDRTCIKNFRIKDFLLALEPTRSLRSELNFKLLRWIQIERRIKLIWTKLKLSEFYFTNNLLDINKNPLEYLIENNNFWFNRQEIKRIKLKSLKHLIILKIMRSSKLNKLKFIPKVRSYIVLWNDLSLRMLMLYFLFILKRGLLFIWSEILILLNLYAFFLFLIEIKAIIIKF